MSSRFWPSRVGVTRLIEYRHDEQNRKDRQCDREGGDIHPSASYEQNFRLEYSSRDPRSWMYPMSEDRNPPTSDPKTSERPTRQRQPMTVASGAAADTTGDQPRCGSN